MAYTNLGKRIISGITVSITLLVITWSIWITKNTFSSQETRVNFQEYRVEVKEKQSTIQDELKELQKTIEKQFDKLNDKIDSNAQLNNKNILDLQKQIGELRSETQHK